MEDVGMFYGHLVYFKTIWYVLWPFLYFEEIWCISSVLVCGIKKNLATLTTDRTIYCWSE
jgi:hypothetical protein